MDLIYLFDLFGTCIFAITGAVKGVRCRLDILGVLAGGHDHRDTGRAAVFAEHLA